MSHFFDTSMLVAAFDDQDSCHERAQSVFMSHADGGAIATHTIAETFSILTGRRAWRASEAFEILRVNTAPMAKVTITASDYLRVVEEAESLGVRGGAIYDVLILAAARKARATNIWTLNRRHFELFAQDWRNRIREP
jgi:predicted nucleic acid-binding protein